MSRTVLNGLQFPNVSALPAALSNPGVILALGSVLYYSNGNIWIPLSSHLLPAKNSGTFSAAISTTETYVTPTFSIPANVITVGMAFRLKLSGVATSTVANAVTFSLRHGAAGTTADAAELTLVTTAAASGTNVTWSLEATMVATATGASGTFALDMRLLNSGVTGLSNAAVAGSSSAGAATPITQAATSFIGISVKTAATTTTVRVNTATVEQVS